MASYKGLSGGIKTTVVGRVNHNEVTDTDGILVAVATEPTMLQQMLKAAAVVTANGGVLSHAAIVCTARGIPFVVGAKGVTDIPQGTYIEVNTTDGTVTVLD